MGDINLGRGVKPDADSFGFLTSRLLAADLALANLESPLATHPPEDPRRNNYNLCTSSSSTEHLVKWGLDLLSIANNHRFDCGEDGPSHTASLLTDAGLTPLGLNIEPVIRHINGVKLAFFAFDDVLTPLDAEAATAAIRKAKEDGALVIVSLHWGVEYKVAPTERQQALARQLAQAGATLLWGHHPHVLQRAEWLETEAGRTLVLYSLGNALFDQGGLEEVRQSVLVLVTLQRGKITTVEAIPFEIDLRHSQVLEPEAVTRLSILQQLGLP
ncbi:MAG: CapA family protein [Anaerolineales bacterium]|nr:CapA family protein [Anaerolineales bacterium]MCX7608067.1 CapA family protein [Anaerolineales bacterium]MDW8227829.1 CapA family protein [Anaerolineales bacterium]